jgi:hypothetical protein
MATVHPHGPKPVWMRLPQRVSHRIHPLPLALPWEVPGAFQRTAPVVAGAFDATAQLYSGSQLSLLQYNSILYYRISDLIFSAIVLWRARIVHRLCTPLDKVSYGL